MIAENSGKIYRFKLDHSLGFGYAELYDFTDISSFDGRYVYVYEILDNFSNVNYSINELRNFGISLGPIALYKFPNTKGLNSWKFLFKTNDYLIKERPLFKNVRIFNDSHYNWNDLDTWFIPSSDSKAGNKYIKYETIRHLETEILNSNMSVAKKFSMKQIIDKGDDLSKYYDLSEIGNRNMFVQLINTYYPLEQTLELLKLIK